MNNLDMNGSKPVSGTWYYSTTTESRVKSDSQTKCPSVEDTQADEEKVQYPCLLMRAGTQQSTEHLALRHPTQTTTHSTGQISGPHQSPGHSLTYATHTRTLHLHSAHILSWLKPKL